MFKRCGVVVQPYASVRALGRFLTATLTWLLILFSAARLIVPLAEPLAFGLVMLFATLGAVLGLLGLACLIYTPFAWLRAVVGSSGAAVVRVGGALSIEHSGDRSSFPLASLTSARLSSSGGEVALRTDDGDIIRVRLDEPGDAERLLGAIATGRARGTWSARLYDAPLPLGRRLFVGVAALVTLVCWAVIDLDVAISLGVVTGVAAWALAALLREGSGRRVLVVGHDGVSIRSDGGERFISFRSIERVDETCLGVELVLRGGEEVALTIVPPQLLRDPTETGLSMVLAEWRREHLLGLLRKRIGRDDPEAGGAGALLERRGRPAPAWRAALRCLMAEAGADYRTAKLTREQALAVLEDGGAPAELRIGAALALSSARDRATAERLRIAAEGCASCDVRIALEQAADGEVDEGTLDRALSGGGAAQTVLRSTAPAA
ncbi:hypothetical protein SOCEGT47_055750 [Sorangium cellulosum]|uniref:Uncharacterized protein n=1 Tax=Sorangium cellulosum TaxID=56 RepID=A0A4P2Q7N5_SORCE|nr:hypothetical protein [Sorangium cellulosum]AUX25033.1 hypothetical protein SOCEGT47_055750 [Sorangium cellulosum]